MVSWRPKITDMPAGLLINRILPFCEAKDVLSLGCTSRFFAVVAGHYGFTGSEAVRTGIRKFIYGKPRIFVWGWVTFSFSGVTRVFICSLMLSHILV